MGKFEGTLTGRKSSEPEMQNLRPALKPVDRETVEALRRLLVGSVQKGRRDD